MKKTLTLLFGLLALPALVKGRDGSAEDLSENTLEPEEDASPGAGRGPAGGVNLRAVANTLEAVTEALGRMETAEEDRRIAKAGRRWNRLATRWFRRFAGKGEG